MPDFSTVVEALHYHAEHKGSKPAFIFRHPEFASAHDRVVQTFSQIHCLGGRFAAVLKSRGPIGRGDLVANTLPNCPERVVCEAGVLMTGAATVNAHCLLSDGSDLINTLRQSRARAVLVDPEVAQSPWTVLREHLSVDLDPDGGTVSSSAELPDLKRIFFVRSEAQDAHGSFLPWLEASADLGFEAGDVAADDVCSVFSTSGSSGFSKLVVHTHGGLCEAVVGNNPVFKGLTGDEVEFSMAPLGWMGGYAGNSFLSGTTRVLCNTRDGLPKDVVGFMLQCVREERINLMFVPAPRLEPLLQRVKNDKEKEPLYTHHDPNPDLHPDRKSASVTESRARSQDATGKPGSSDRPGNNSLHIVDRLTLGGQPITRSFVKMASLLAPSVFVLYGSTETFLMSSMTLTDPDTFVDHDGGLPVKGSSWRVVSPQDEDVEVDAGQAGLLLFKRGAMMKEYLHDARATAAAFTPDGLFRTGDLGRIDARGHVIVEGRTSDAIMRGPYIFYPGWLEERIRACPGVRDVMVVGVPEHGESEEICACVTLTSGEVTVQQVRDFVERDIVVSEEEPLSPRPRHYLTFDSFPSTSTGKPLRTEIKQQAAVRLASTTGADE